LVITFAKVIGFVVAMPLVGAQLVRWLLDRGASLAWLITRRRLLTAAKTIANVRVGAIIYAV
jgi:predicted Kef-type K+ transport protein